jgi:hypothetical protein
MASDAALSEVRTLPEDGTMRSTSTRLLAVTLCCGLALALAGRGGGGSGGVDATGGASAARPVEVKTYLIYYSRSASHGATISDEATEGEAGRCWRGGEGL